jgi:hypothetical protein
LGVAQLTKMSLLVLYPVWVVMWVVYRVTAPSPNPLPEGEGEKDALSSRGARWLRWRELVMLGVQFAISIYVLNLGYGFEGTFTRLGDFQFVSAALAAEGDGERARVQGGNRFADSWLAGLPVPLPKHYVLGIDLQKRDFENYDQPSYLRGEFRKKGWWYYYLYALAIKVPLGTWVLFLLACTAGWWKRLLTTHPSPLTSSPPWRDEFVVLCPAVVILAFVSSQTGFSEHMRYVLPIFPFVFIWICTLGNRRAAVGDYTHTLRTLERKSRIFCE